MWKNAVKVLTDWLAKVNGGDLEGVLALYHEDADLLPTFSSEIRMDPESIRRYFVQLSANDRIVVELDENSLIVQKLSDNLYTLGGIYSWLLVAGEKENRFLARFTYTIDIDSDKPILHHHSSLVPEG